MRGGWETYYFSIWVLHCQCGLLLPELARSLFPDLQPKNLPRISDEIKHVTARPGHPCWSEAFDPHCAQRVGKTQPHIFNLCVSITVQCRVVSVSFKNPLGNFLGKRLNGVFTVDKQAFQKAWIWKEIK